MPLFVFISGYIYSYSKLGLDKYNDNLLFIINKIKRLILPYFFVAIFYMIPIRLFLVPDFYQGENFYDIFIQGILLSKNTGSLWYLLMLFNVFLLFRWMEKYIHKFHWKNVFFLFIILHFVKFPQIFQISSAFHHLLYFYLGYLTFQKQSILPNYLMKIRYANICFLVHLLIFSISFYVTNFANYTQPSVVKYTLRLSTPILSILGIAFTYAYLFYFHQRQPKINNTIYHFLDKHNFTIYLFHAPIVYVIASRLVNSTICPFFLISLCFVNCLPFLSHSS